MDYQNSAAKYKSVLKKVKPVNEPMPQDTNPPLGRPPLSRDPYNTPLSAKPPKFMVTRSEETRLNSSHSGESRMPSSA